MCLQLAAVRQGCPTLAVYLKRPQWRAVPSGRMHTVLFATLSSCSSSSQALCLGQLLPGIGGLRHVALGNTGSWPLDLCALWPNWQKGASPHGVSNPATKKERPTDESRRALWKLWLCALFVNTPCEHGHSLPSSKEWQDLLTLPQA